MKCLCLTLPEQRERSDKCRAHLQSHGLSPHMICGINGPLSGLKSSHPYEHDHPGTGYVIGPCTIGIFLSHYIAWSICDALPDEQVLILEDDVILCPDFKSRLNRILLDVPENWDMIFLGSCCTSGHPSTHINGDIYDIRWPQCLHAYVVNKRCIPVLLSNLRDVYGPIDCLLKVGGFFGLKVYTVIPRIAEQTNTELPQ